MFNPVVFGFLFHNVWVKSRSVEEQSLQPSPAPAGFGLASRMTLNSWRTTLWTHTIYGDLMIRFIQFFCMKKGINYLYSLSMDYSCNSLNTILNEVPDFLSISILA
jgi:hypothetical protein